MWVFRGNPKTGRDPEIGEAVEGDWRGEGTLGLGGP